MPWTQVNKILLVGGMTRMPMVRENDLQARFRSAGRRRESRTKPVAVGAAIQAVLSLLNEEEATGEKMLPSETRQQFSSREGGLIKCAILPRTPSGWSSGMKRISRNTSSR
jgi:molecular chaperone DnaK